MNDKKIKIGYLCSICGKIIRETATKLLYYTNKLLYYELLNCLFLQKVFLRRQRKKIRNKNKC